MLIPLLVVSGVAVVAMYSASASMDAAMDNMLEGTVPISELQSRLLQARTLLHDQLGGVRLSDGQEFKTLSEEISAAFKQVLEKDTPTGVRLSRLEQGRDEWQKGRQIYDNLIAGQDPAQTAARLKSFDACVSRAVERLGLAQESAREQVQAAQRNRAGDITRQMIIVNALVLAAGLCAMLLIAYALSRSIARPLRTLEEGTHRIGEGDLFHRVVLESKDEIGRLAHSFNAMAEKLERGQATLENLSVHDGLTGLYNYREFRRRLKEEADRSRRYGRPFSLLLLDLDHFKVVNDTYGHQAGDEVLRALANLISEGVRPVDMAARYGGEEIALILPETPGGKALIVAERVRSLVANHPIKLSSGPTVNLTCSIGVAAFGEDGASDNEIIGSADSALYAAKHAGRNRVCRLEKT